MKFERLNLDDNFYKFYLDNDNELLYNGLILEKYLVSNVVYTTRKRGLCYLEKLNMK